MQAVLASHPTVISQLYCQGDVTGGTSKEKEMNESYHALYQVSDFILVSACDIYEGDWHSFHLIKLVILMRLSIINEQLQIAVMGVMN
jgi:hypothetical protein